VAVHWVTSVSLASKIDLTIGSNIGTRAISTSCIQSPGALSVISLQQCGSKSTHQGLGLHIDGIVEPENGEECDPGANSTSACCDPSSMFRIFT